ncbi:mannosyl-oligosaccharide alpha-1,2-mannosidase IA [Phlebotomus argentipes]|uniref:mannosyl-oligosaccharide alpha-1,2-mannosidase IA n=1 Tax=Phlebotomus argentipes TaxID=94469 RepID=UPI00289354A8|nr:mannosyl-oligosaccharide alpha-1,2-mannosidase IA [Phlebotomus argentipes]
MLPTYSRSTTTPATSLFQRKLFRNSERLLVILVLLTFCLVCFCGLFFLPDNFSSNRVFSVYKQLQKAGPEIFIPAPPVAQQGFRGDGGVDPHLLDDREKLQAKIQGEIGDIIDRPEVQKAPPLDKSLGDGVQQEGPLSGGVDEDKTVTTTLKFGPDSGQDSDSSIREKREKVKQMMLLAWNNYKQFAWGKNELRPISKRAHTGSVFGAFDFGATIIDGLDTLYIMGLEEEFEEGREWLRRRFSFDNVSVDISVFETNIRFVGGLLTCYALTGDPLFRDKAVHVADKLLPAFQTPTGIPLALVNLKTGVSKNYGWASGGSSILSEFGTLHLEFAYLSDITGNPIYRERVQNVRQVLRELEKPKGLYPNYLNPKTGKWGQYHMSLGALGDSYFEYLLKAWIQSGREDQEARVMFDEAMPPIIEHMVRTSPNGLIYVSDMKFDRLEHKMDHLACFAGGLFGLGSQTLSNEWSTKYMEIAHGLTNTCHESYIRTQTKLGPESFRFSEAAEAKALKTSEKYYILRPETFESYFVMWRLTHQQKYRDWGWEAVQALEKHCRTPNGYSGVKNVYMEEPQKDDVQQSFFLAETLKYLYLLFSDDSFIPLDEWVFNTEAHPLPIKGINSLYRAAPMTTPTQQ